jgi:hypothetical protein
MEQIRTTMGAHIMDMDMDMGTRAATTMDLTGGTATTTVTVITVDATIVTGTVDLKLSIGRLFESLESPEIRALQLPVLVVPFAFSQSNRVFSAVIEKVRLAA